MAHVADRILAAVQARLAVVPGIVGAHVKPLHLLEEDQLPALVIDEIEDTVDSATGFFPVAQTRELKFVVQICQLASSDNFSSLLTTLHEDVSLALFGSLAATNLGGLLTRGLSEQSAALFTDSESLQQVVGGWRITVSCTYNLRSDMPGKTEKETS
jgi:hypothetical protein